MYTEVLQDAVVDLIRQGRVKFGSTCSLTVTNECLQGIYDDIDFFRDKLVMRPSEISNNPEIIRRLGVISINTAIEADICKLYPYQWNQDDERYRWFGRLHPQCLYFHLYLSIRCQRRKNQRHRSYGIS